MARVLLTNFHVGPGGGHTTYIEALTKISNNSSHVIGVAVAESSRLYRRLKADSHPYLYSCDFPGRVLKNPLKFINSVRRFRDVVFDFKPDIVHSNGGSDLFISLWSHPYSGKYKIVRTHHASRPIRKDPYHWHVFRHLTDANIYVSTSSFEMGTSRSITPRNAAIIENGVDVDKFSPTPKNLTLAREYGIDADTFCFGTSGGTKPYKRIDTIIRAATLIRSEREYKILVLGSMAPELQDLADKLGVGQFVCCGFQEEVIPHISLFDVGFILSDRIETISFATREMMSMGKPIISSSYSGLKENVLNGVNGFLVQPGNIDEIAASMTKFLEMDNMTLRKFSENARKYAIDHFNIKKQLEAHASLYEKIMN